MNAQLAGTQPETKAEIVVRLLKQGGYLMVVGGGAEALPDRIREHQQILIWDDNQQGHEHKTVPSNTRAILTNKWISHAAMRRVRYAADQLRIPIFPMLTTREIKELLATFIQEDVVPTVTTETINIPDEPVVQQEEPTEMRTPKRGEIQEIIKKYGIIDNMSSKKNADRLLDYVKKAGLKQTVSALEQKIAIMRKGKTKIKAVEKPVASVAETATLPTSSNEDFVEAEKMLRDAKAAIDLLLDFIPKIRKEVVSIRKKQAKLRELLGDE